MAILNKFTFAALFGLIAVYSVHSFFGPDIWYHLSWGRDLIANSQLMPHVRTLVAQPIPANIYWIFQILMYETHKLGGLYAVSALFALLWLAIAALWLYLSRANTLLFFIFVVLAALRFEERPEIFSYLFLLILIWQMMTLKTAKKPWLIYVGLFALENIWTGLHGYFALGPFLAVALVLSDPRTWKRNSGALAAVVLGSVSGPFGLAAWETVWDYAKLGTQLSDLNQELFAPSLWPPSWPTSLFWLTWAFVLALGARSIWRRENLFAAFIASGGLVLSAQTVRNMPLFWLLAAPLLAHAKIPSYRRLVVVCQIMLIAVSGFLAYRFINPARPEGELSTFGVKEEWASYPVGAAEFLRAQNFSGDIFTDSYDGGYLEFALPQIRVAGDSYFSDPVTTRQYFEAIKDPAAFAKFCSTQNFAALLVNVENFLIVDQLLSDPRWSLTYADSHRALFQAHRDTESPADVLSHSNFWHGESLTNANYAFGPMTWAAIVGHHQWQSVLRKIVQDLEPANFVPAKIMRPILSYAIAKQDTELLKVSLPLTEKTNGETGYDAEVLTDLKAKAATCCH